MNIVAIVVKVLTCAVMIVTFALNMVLFGYLCRGCFSCDRKQYVQKLANSFFGVALGTFISMFLFLLIFGIHRYVAGGSAGIILTTTFMVSLGSLAVLMLVTIMVTAMAGVIMADVKKSLELFSCGEVLNRVSPRDDGYVPFKRARGVCIAAMVLSLIVLLASVFSLARELAPKVKEWNVMYPRIT